MSSSAAVEQKVLTESVDEGSSQTYEITEEREVPRKPRNKVIQAFTDIVIWYPKNYDEPERKLLFKLDVIILTYACLGFFIKSIDASNVKYAYVSGMKEDLGLYGNELNWINWTYQIGYVVGQLPGLILISRPKISKYVFPTIEIFYGILTFCQSRVNHINQLYAIRFLVGVFESPAYAGTHFVLGKWYGTKPHRGNTSELFKRAGTWYATQSIANFFTGHLQAAAYKSLNGVHGYKGWQWLFIIDGVITLPIAFLGFAIWPGIPESGKPRFLTDDQYALVFKRLKRYGVKQAEKITFKTLRDTLSSWKWYLFCFNYTIMCVSWYPISYFSLWLKSKGTYSVEDINRYPTYSDIIGLFVCLIGTTVAGVYPPWVVYSVCATGPLVCSIILSIYHVPDAAIFFGFYYSYLITATTTILYSYANTVLRENNEMKAITLGSMMTFAQTIPSSISFGIFPTADKKHPARAAPQWNIGWRVTVVTSAFMILSFILITYLHEREKKLGTAFKITDDSEDESNSIDDSDQTSQEIELEELGTKDSTKHRVREVSEV